MLVLVMVACAMAWLLTFGAPQKKRVRREGPITITTYGGWKPSVSTAQTVAAIPAATQTITPVPEEVVWSHLRDDALWSELFQLDHVERSAQRKRAAAELFCDPGMFARVCSKEQTALLEAQQWVSTARETASLCLAAEGSTELAARRAASNLADAISEGDRHGVAVELLVATRPEELTRAAWAARGTLRGAACAELAQALRTHLRAEGAAAAARVAMKIATRDLAHAGRILTIRGRKAKA